MTVVFVCVSWRAAEHLCQYLIDHPHRFANKYICELGCGLGLVSILLEKMALENTRIVATDGDEPTLQLLIENKVENECDFDTAYLYWGQDEDFVQEYCTWFVVVAVRCGAELSCAELCCAAVQLVVHLLIV